MRRLSKFSDISPTKRKSNDSNGIVREIAGLRRRSSDKDLIRGLVDIEIKNMVEKSNEPCIFKLCRKLPIFR